MRLTNEQNQHDNGYDVRNHGDDLGINHVGGTQNNLQTGAATEQQTADQCALRLKLTEDNRRNRNKALTNDGDGTELVGDCHGYASATQTGQEAGDSNAQHTHTDNVNAQSFASVGVFAASTHTQTEASLVEDEPYNHNCEECQEGGCVVGQ